MPILPLNLLLRIIPLWGNSWCNRLILEALKTHKICTNCPEFTQRITTMLYWLRVSYRKRDIVWYEIRDEIKIAHSLRKQNNNREFLLAWQQSQTFSTACINLFRHEFGGKCHSVIQLSKNSNLSRILHFVLVFFLEVKWAPRRLFE